MLRNRVYFLLKPFIPRSVRLGVRRWLSGRKRERTRDIWPIMPGSERRPAGWPGWPEGKKFALVLTHDVERAAGLANCGELMRLEQKLGFRSSFNFVPEGDYRVPRELREELVRKGFEVGIHDLKHDGRLYKSRAEFGRGAARINQYVKEWGAAGFRSGFMLHQLDWLHDLNIEYDASTFDTDPFEPQPEGRHTIFPFWVSRPSLNAHLSAGALAKEEPSPVRRSLGEGGTLNGATPGYVELPYTLPQDSTLFLLLRERSIDLWKTKVDWIAQHGGMVLLNTHPDYMQLKTQAVTNHAYPIDFYDQLLRYIRSKYSGSYWHVLPREVAGFVRQAELQACRRSGSDSSRALRSVRPKPKVWIDMDNTPHVPFFEPIVDELRSRGFPLLVTARDAFQVCDLADKKGLHYVRVGRHHGKNPALKACGLAYRALQLAPLILREKPALGVSHGARSQLILSNALRIPTLLIEDYEYSRFPTTMRPAWIMAPSVIPDHLLPLRNGHIRKYTGIKEDVYAWKLRPDKHLLIELGLTESDLIVTVRPPATEAHYHNPEGERLFERFMERASQTAGVRVVLLPRNQKQTNSIREHWPGWFEEGRTVIPSAALDGLNLLWHSDLVVSGGGTMNREAAALGVPVYSIFRGSIGAVDQHLSAQGRLVLIESAGDVDNKIPLVKRSRKAITEVTSHQTLHEIVDGIEEIAEFCRHSA